MRISLNRRILRQAQRASAASSAAPVQATPLHSRGVAVPLFALARGLHASSLHSSSMLRGLPVISPKIQVRLINSVPEDNGDDLLADTERADRTEIIEAEGRFLQMLERGFKGEKNWHIAKDVFDELQASNGQGLTQNVSAALVEVFATRQLPLECLEVLRFSREHGVRPRIHAYSTAISCCYKQQMYAQALRVFEIMRNDGFVPQHVTYSRALSAALKSRHHELVLEIFDDMVRNRVEPEIVTYNTILNSCARVGDGHTALGVLRAIDERGIEMTQSTYHSLAICGGKSGNWEMSHDAYHELIASGFTPAMNLYNAVLSAYAKGKQWDRIISVYNEMPTEMRDQLYNTYLGGVLMAFAKADDPAVCQKTIEIFEHHKARKSELNVFAYNAVLMCYLKSNQFDEIHALVQEMKGNKMDGDGLTQQYVILAHLRSGNVAKAEQLLNKNVKHMKISTMCYRELIQYYGEVRKDPLAACKHSMEMMQYNHRLSRRDWITAFTYALQAENRQLYWNFRKWFKVRAPNLVDMPAELMLEQEDEVKLKPKQPAASG